MTRDGLIELAQFSTILIGFLGIAVALRSHRRQMNAQMFIEFSARFQSVLRALPAEAWITNCDGHQPIPAPSEDLTKKTLEWFYLLLNLFHLHREGYISPDLWRPSQRGLKRALQNPLMQREWLAVEGAFTHYPEYCHYVRGLIKEGGGRLDAGPNLAAMPDRHAPGQHAVSPAKKEAGRERTATTDGLPARNLWMAPYVPKRCKQNPRGRSNR